MFASFTSPDRSSRIGGSHKGGSKRVVLADVPLCRNVLQKSLPAVKPCQNKAMIFDIPGSQIKPLQNRPFAKPPFCKTSLNNLQWSDSSGFSRRFSGRLTGGFHFLGTFPQNQRGLTMGVWIGGCENCHAWGAPILAKAPEHSMLLHHKACKIGAPQDLQLPPSPIQPIRSLLVRRGRKSGAKIGEEIILLRLRNNDPPTSRSAKISALHGSDSALVIGL